MQVYLVCISVRRGNFTGSTDLQWRDVEQDTVSDRISERVRPVRNQETLLSERDSGGKYSFCCSGIYECDVVCGRYILKKQIFAVCDLEEEYARNFMEYLNQKKNLPFEVQAFTSVESLLAYGRENHIELLLISAQAMCKEVEELSTGKTMILTEGTKPEELDAYAGVYKYQASSDIVREVMACYGESRVLLPQQIPALKKTTKILGVYSPIGRCLQTFFALTLGQILGREKSVLYVNMEEYAGFEELLNRKFSRTLSDLLYFGKQENANIMVQLSGTVQSMGRLDFIPPVQFPEDIRETSFEEWEILLREIILHSSYEVIILDIGNVISDIFQLLDMCSQVYMPVRADVMSRCKIEQFENLLKLRDYGQILAKTVKMRLHLKTGELKGTTFMEQLVWSELGDYIREMIRKGEI